MNNFDIDGPYSRRPFVDLDRPWIRAIVAVWALALVTVALLWLAA